MILNASPLAGRGGRAGGCLSPGPTAGAEGSPRRLGRARVRHSGRGLVPSLRARHGRLRPLPPGPAPLPPGMHQGSPLVAATALRVNSSLINGPSPRVFCFSARSSPAGPGSLTPGSLTAASQPRQSPARYLPVSQPPPATKGRPKGTGVRQTVRRRAAAVCTGRSVGLAWGGGGTIHACALRERGELAVLCAAGRPAGAGGCCGSAAAAGAGAGWASPGLAAGRREGPAADVGCRVARRGSLPFQPQDRACPHSPARQPPPGQRPRSLQPVQQPWPRLRLPPARQPASLPRPRQPSRVAQHPV